MADTKLSKWLAKQIGPRRVGGRYTSGYWGSEYEVLDIKVGDQPAWAAAWTITVLGEDGETREHCTAWDPRRDKVVSQPGDAQIEQAR